MVTVISINKIKQDGTILTQKFTVKTTALFDVTEAENV